MLFPWKSHGNSMEIPWHSHGVSMAFPWDLHRFPWVVWDSGSRARPFAALFRAPRGRRAVGARPGTAGRGGGREAEPGGPQQHPDSLTTTAKVFPTEAKERERERRKAAKAAGTKHEVKKRTVHVEEHYDDCGEDMRSLGVTSLIT